MLDTLRLLDFIVIGIGVLIILAIGARSARRSRSAEAYFLAGRSLPGWVVGFSVMATVVSSMTFLANPAFTYEKDWRHMPANCTYLLAMALALALFIPFYRRLRVASIYEYLERRFGAWARLYAAACYLLIKIAKMGIVLYMTSLALQTIVGGDVSLEMVMLVFGIIVAAYTIAGGLEAVVWTDLLQGITLIGGGLICLPIIASKLPGGFNQIIESASEQGKFGVGDTDFTLVKITLWATIVSKFFIFCQVLGTDQAAGQRYNATKSEKEARKALVFGCLLTIPVWAYFFLIGTSLFVLYQVHPDPQIANMKPDQVFPHFILTQVPAGFAGFVVLGILSAAMSTLDSIINAAAATATTDFYQRLWVKDREPEHYAFVGRMFSLLFGVIMVGSALLIHYSREASAIEDLQTMILTILSGGIVGLFLLGFLTYRVDGRAAFVATVVTVLVTALWLFLGSATGEELFPAVAEHVPHKLWIGIFANALLFVLGYLVSHCFRRRGDCAKDLAGLTVWEPGWRVYEWTRRRGAAGSSGQSANGRTRN
ncbi:MAG: sodium/solute symporter [Planctomycetes bacterium]|nr:sodium/solute symporter [Planctomycetota bacterium]